MPVVVNGKCLLLSVQEAIGKTEFLALQQKLITLQIKTAERAALYADIVAGGSDLRNFLKTEIGIKAWGKVNAGGIKDFVQQSGYIKTLEKVAKYQDEALAGSSGTVKYYRVQGGAGTGTSQELLTLEANGNLTFNTTSNALNLSTTTREHADYFIQCCRPGGKIIEFEVLKSFDIQMKQAAVPQYKSSQNLMNSTGTAPKIVDPNQPGDPFELTSYWHKLLQQNYISGSAKLIN
jgi:hypothetical protein